MPARKIVTPPAAIDFQAIRDELNIPTRYPTDAVREAEAAAGGTSSWNPEATRSTSARNHLPAGA